MAGSGSNATSEAFTYNDRGQALTAAGSAGSTTYGYNGDGQVASVADAAGTTSYTYDDAGRLATLASPATGTTATYSYNPDSQVSGISDGTGNDSQSFGYDAQRRLTSDTLKTSAGATVASVGYGYDADSQVTSETMSGLAGPASSTYTYDEAGRLTSWKSGTVTPQYGYDGNGNLTTDGAKSYAYDARDELTGDGTNSYAYTARGTASSESSPSGTVAVSFDAYGDQASAGTRSYTYDALGRLTGDAPSSGSGYAFSYVGKSGTIASDGTSAYTWDPSGSTLAATGAPGGGTGGKLALTDAHGDVVGQFTAAGTAVAGSQAYDPWGTVTAATGTMAGMLGYQSAWSDPASGKDLMGARWYAPSAGDFTSADTVQVSPDPDPAAGDPFAYAADNPLTYTDPTGHLISAGSPATNPNYQADTAYANVFTQTYQRVGVTQAKANAAKAAAAVTAAKKAAAQAAAKQHAEQQALALTTLNSRNKPASAGAASGQQALNRSRSTALNPDDGKVGQNFINPGARDLGTGTTKTPVGDHGTETLITPEGSPFPLILTNPGAPDLGIGILKTPVGNQGTIINTADSPEEILAGEGAERGTGDLPRSVAGPNGETIPLPVDGPGTPVNSGKGLAYDIPAGTEGLNSRVVAVRVMDPVTTGKHQYSNGYVVYMNSSGQSVNPLTGQTVSKADPYNHIPLP